MASIDTLKNPPEVASFMKKLLLGGDFSGWRGRVFSGLVEHTQGSSGLEKHVHDELSKDHKGHKKEDGFDELGAVFDG